jgi:hypothetical protein
MYHVTVFLTSGEAYDSRDFTFGTWQEIGLWLDYYGYNDPDYHVTVRFTNA